MWQSLQGAPSSLGKYRLQTIDRSNSCDGIAQSGFVTLKRQTLIDSLEFNPQLVKPNNHELGISFGVTLTELPARRYAKKSWPRRCTKRHYFHGG